jgi:glycosyltransferase involved in cell wall biosynthesis
MEELADYFRAASVCVSIPSSDSSPRSVWEAMACGCPCVLSDLPWVHESIVDGREALVTTIDARAVADAIGRVLRDPALAAPLAVHGRALVERDHDRASQIDQLVAEYHALLARGAS